MQQIFRDTLNKTPVQFLIKDETKAIVLSIIFHPLGTVCLKMY